MKTTGKHLSSGPKSAAIVRAVNSLGKATLDDMDTVDKKIEAAIASLRAELVREIASTKK